MRKSIWEAREHIIRWGLLAYECYREGSLSREDLGPDGWWKYDGGARVIGAIGACLHHRINRRDEILLTAKRTAQESARLVGYRLADLDGIAGFWQRTDNGVYRPLFKLCSKPRIAKQR